MKPLSIIERAAAHPDRVAVWSKSQRVLYRDILVRSEAIAAGLLDTRDDLREERIAYLLPAGADHIAVQWGIWRAGGIAVPLCLSATKSELQYTLSDAQADCIITNRELAERFRSLGDDQHLRVLVVDELDDRPVVDLPEIDSIRRAMILYTSGTTSKPKRVVTTHACIESQIESLVAAWRWQPDDRIPLFLPLHHVHGIINVMSCALWSGATIEPFSRFDSDEVLSRVADHAYSVFMAVPTIYVKMIQALESMPADARSRVVAGFQEMRLMISGSAALPASVHTRWTELTGQRLLERYGMTEIGMALSNPYDGERRPGAVGQPLPGVDIQLRTEHGLASDNEPGEIHVRGPCVFLEYWRRPDATREAFRDGWFKTGDIAILDDGYYRIMGRSVDIIKSGGYKLSALEIEATLLDHPAISECAVVGVPDETWGEAVAAAVVICGGQQFDPDAFRAWSRDRMSAYKIPQQWLAVDQLPRNAMGKVTKPEVVKCFTKHQT